MTTPLLATKTYIPTPRTTLVPRPRLVERLNAGLRHKLTLISAPAGFGKTTLVSAWVESYTAPLTALPQRVAWLSLSREDNDPAQFWRYVVAALQTVDGTLGQTAQAALQASPPPPLETLVTTLINDFLASGQDRPCILILDDYHVIENPSIHDSLNFLLDHAPPQLHLVIATREDPPLVLPRRRARTELVEIRASDLRFTVKEAAAFLNTLAGLNLSPEDVAALEERTEGWIAGLQMAALSLQQQTPTDQHDFVTAFAGDDRYIVDYLVQEVFQLQSPHIQAFLLQTSILERMCGPLCDAVTESDGGQETLEYLEQANLFTLSLDNRRYWYRYHQLFADLLRQRLTQSADAPSIDTLYRRASAWCQQEELIPEAVTYALATSDPEYAAALVERHALDVFFHSEIPLLHRWLEALPAETVRAHPLLHAIQATTQLLVSAQIPTVLDLTEARLQEAEETLTAQEWGTSGSGAPGRPTHDEVAGFISNIRAYLSRFRGDAPQSVIALSQQALDRLPKDDLRFRSALLNNIGFAYWTMGNDDAACRAFAEARRIGVLNGDLFNTTSATRCQALIIRKYGRLGEATAICQECLQIIDAHGGMRDRPVPYAGGLHVALGEILLEQNDLEAAGQQLAKGLSLIELIGHDITTDGQIALARLKHTQGDAEQALALLEQAEQLNPAALPRITAQRARFWLAQAADEPHKLARAVQWAEERQIVLTSKLDHNFLTHVEQTTLYRLLVAQHRAQRRPDLRPLLDCLDRRLRFVAEKGWHEWAIDLLAVRALALQAQGEQEAAITSLQQALALAEPEGYVRIFLDEGTPMRQLLYEIATRGATHDPAPAYAGASVHAGALLAAALDAGEPRAKPAPHEPLIEPLSAREIEVLQLVATGKSNPQVARELFVTVNTVKKHLTHIFGKLGVKNRTQAVAHARQLGLLE